MRKKLKFLLNYSGLAAIGVLGLAPCQALAQSAPPEPPLPTYQSVDANGFELSWGAFKEMMVTSNIGPDDTGLKSQAYSYLDNPEDSKWGYWTKVRDNNFGAIYTVDSTGEIHVKIGDYDEGFTTVWHTEIIQGVGVNYIQQFDANGQPKLMPSNASESYKAQKLELIEGGQKYLYTNSAGVEYTFDKYIGTGSQVVSLAQAYLTKIKYPDGRVTNMFYKQTPGDCGNYPEYCAARLISVWNNSGYMLKYSYDGWGNMSAVTAVNSSDQFCEPTAETCSLASYWQKWNFTHVAEGAQLNLIPWERDIYDPFGNKYEYRGHNRIVYPSGNYKRLQKFFQTTGLTSFVETNAPVDYYLVKPNGTWKYARLFDDVAVGAVEAPGNPQMYLIGYGAHAKVVDPFGNVTRFNFNYSSEDHFYPLGDTAAQQSHKFYTLIGSGISFGFMGDVTLPGNRIFAYMPAQIVQVDENGAPVMGDFGPEMTGSKGVYAFTVTPEGNKTEYEYDLRVNVTKKTFRSKDGNQTISINYGYSPTCANMKVCNKPNYIINPEGKQTDFTYDPVHGGVLTITAPVDSAGARAQTRFVYEAKYAKVKNASGQLVTVSDPIYKLIHTSTCSEASPGNPASCVGTDKETVTTYEYNSDNLLLTSITVRAGNANPAQPYSQSNLWERTSYGYDIYGNKISVDGPRVDIDDQSYATYDILRRKVFEVSADPDGPGGPLKRVVKKHQYNADGNEIRTESGTGNATDGSDFVVTSYTAMTYENGLVTKTVTAHP